MNRWLDFLQPHGSVFVEIGPRVAQCDIAARTLYDIWLDMGPSGLVRFDAVTGQSAEGWQLIGPTKGNRWRYDDQVLLDLLPGETRGMTLSQRLLMAHEMRINLHGVF